jgi:hypothetical protein
MSLETLSLGFSHPRSFQPRCKFRLLETYPFYHQLEQEKTLKMRLSKLFFPLFTATYTGAASIKDRQLPQSDPRVMQYRIFGDEGCNANNRGFYTIDMSETMQCRQIDQDPAVQSVLLEQSAPGCTCK